MRLAIRADGNGDVGYGHLVRTGALAEAFLKAGHAVTYLTRTPDGVSAVCPAGVETVTLPEDSRGEHEWVVAYVEESDVDILLTDSYDVDAVYQAALRPIVPVLAVVHDDDRHPLCCDVAVNGNVYADQLEYEWVGDEPRRLFGLEYLLLRAAFRRLAAREAPWREPPERAILLMGGSDVNNATPDAIQALAGFDLKLDVIVGPGFRNRDEIREAAENVFANVRILQNPPDLAERMFEADFAISGAGTTVYELIATDTPTIAIPQAENQWPVARRLQAMEAVLVPGSTGPDSLRDSIRQLLSDSELRRSFRDCDLIDGLGACRVRDILINLVRNQSTE